MTQINAYLNFNGNCREAMTFYKECLGGELALQTVGESPIAGQMPPEATNNILHSTLSKNGFPLMGSDMICNGLVKGNAITSAINCSTEDEINTYFSKLSADGQIREKLSVQFWGATFGSITDKFGTNWMLTYDKSQAA